MFVKKELWIHRQVEVGIRDIISSLAIGEGNCKKWAKEDFIQKTIRSKEDYQSENPG